MLIIANIIKIQKMVIRYWNYAGTWNYINFGSKDRKLNSRGGHIHQDANIFTHIEIIFLYVLLKMITPQLQ